MARKWSQFAARFGKEADTNSWILGVAGLGLTALGAAVSVPIVAVAGGTIALGTVGWCAWQAVPPRMLRPQDNVGRVINDLSELAFFDPPLQRIGVLGPSRVGKTTLLAHLQMQSAPLGRTESVYACVVPVPGSSAFIALIDAAGQQYSQQFKVFDEASAVIILLDHNASDVDNNVLAERLERHTEFLDQLAGHSLSKRADADDVHILLNKRDLWQRGSNAIMFETWGLNIEQNWKKNSRSRVSLAKHSNREVGDMANVTAIIRRWADQ